MAVAIGEEVPNMIQVFWTPPVFRASLTLLVPR
jgi:hypothetical protein